MHISWKLHESGYVAPGEPRLPTPLMLLICARRHDERRFLVDKFAGFRPFRGKDPTTSPAPGRWTAYTNQIVAPHDQTPPWSFSADIDITGSRGTPIQTSPSSSLARWLQLLVLLAFPHQVRNARRPSFCALEATDRVY